MESSHANEESDSGEIVGSEVRRSSQGESFIPISGDFGFSPRRSQRKRRLPRFNQRWLPLGGHVQDEMAPEIFFRKLSGFTQSVMSLGLLLELEGENRPSNRRVPEMMSLLHLPKRKSFSGTRD